METDKQNGGGAAKALNNLNWPTLVLILMSGGANLFLTDKGNVGIQGNREELQSALRQIRDIYHAVDQTDQRQQMAIRNFEQLLENDRKEIVQLNQSLTNQGELIKTQNAILSEMHRLAIAHAAQKP